MQKILEGYQRLLQEFTEQQILLAQNTPPSYTGASGGSDPLEYYPDSMENMHWYLSPNWEDEEVGNLSYFQKLPFDMIYGIWIESDTIPITSIKNISSYPNLTEFWIDNQSLSTLDLSNSQTIKEFGYESNHGTSYIDLSPLVNLKSIYISRNTGVSTIDISKNDQIEGITIIGVFEEIDIIFGKNEKLNNVGLSYCISNFPSVSYPDNIEYLSCHSMRGITSLNTSRNIKLKNLDWVNSVDFMSVNLENNINLTQLFILGCSLASINIENNTKLEGIFLSANQLSTPVINKILIDFDSFPTSYIGGNVWLNGNSPPSGAGITAKNSLIIKGTTVITD
jgi:hypothetical protein